MWSGQPHLRITGFGEEIFGHTNMLSFHLKRTGKIVVITKFSGNPYACRSK
jgi:hypothetical protein